MLIAQNTLFAYDYIVCTYQKPPPFQICANNVPLLLAFCVKICYILSCIGNTSICITGLPV